MLVKKRDHSLHNDADLLESDKAYFVFAILFGNELSFLISEERSFSFPFFISESAVDIFAGKISFDMYFSPALPGSDAASSRSPMLGFKEIVMDRFFYQRLVDGGNDEILIWNKIKDSRN